MVVGASNTSFSPSPSSSADMTSRRTHTSVDLDAAYKPNPDALARRSISIFSRRGIDSFVETSHSPAMRGFPTSLRAVDYSARQKPLSTPRKTTIKPKKAKGTILNAVPQTTTTAQSIAAVLSPTAYANTEKESSPLDFACTTAIQQATTLKETQATIIAEKQETRSPSKKHAKTKSTVDRIGVWVDGIVHWEQGQQFARHSEELDSQSTSVLGHARARSDDSHRSSRPSLKVIIPQGKLLSREQSIAALKRPATSHGLSRRTSAIPKGSFPAREVSPLTDFASVASKQALSRTTTIFSPFDRSRAPSSASRPHDPSRSSSTTPSSAAKDKDEDSEYSKRSSNTSVDGPAQVAKRLQSMRTQKSASAIFSIVNSTVSAALNECTPVTKSYMDKPLPPTPPRSDLNLPFQMPPVLKPTSSTTPKRPQTARCSKTHSPPPPLLNKTLSFQGRALRHATSTNQLDRFDQEFMKTSPYCPDDESESDLESTTLSQAEIDLKEQIGHMSRHLPRIDGLSIMNQELHNSGLHISNVALSDTSQIQTDSASMTTIMQPPSRTPTIPKKSRKRDWHRPLSDEQLHAQTRRLSDPCSLLSDTMHDAPPAAWWIHHRLSRSVSSADLPRLIVGYADFISRDDKLVVERVIDDGLIVVSGPTVMRPQHGRLAMQAAPREAAEGVLVKILASLTSIEDLMNAILINRGMHRVYRENERHLLKSVASNESAPACELREWLRPTRKSQLIESDVGGRKNNDRVIAVEQSPACYVQAWRRDLKTIDSLKSIIVPGCQSFLRKDTVAAMTDKSHTQAQSVTDAFWRIWTFCSIFGSQKGRDEDLTGQLDWLKGGRLANNLDCAATVSTNFDFDVGSILLNAPEYFGSGNGDGLTAEQLYDITEIWTCMASLLQGYLGRVEQARSHGVYDNCDLEQNDTEKEEYMLEEWIAWIVTLGPTVVLELAGYAADSSSAGFALAQRNGWTKWSPPTQTTSRCTFLKDPVARLYEERVTAANAKAHTAREQAEKEESRRRIHAHAQEIRARRQDSAFKRVPLVDMSMERPMSIMSTLSGGVALTPRFPPKNMTLPPVPAAIHPALRSAPAISPASAATLRQAMLTPPMASLSPQISMIMTRHQSAQPVRQALRAFNGVGVGTVELAVQRIMAMGFTDAEATLALKTTDTGDGLRVDRAVDWLLRTRNPSATVKWTG